MCRFLKDDEVKKIADGGRTEKKQSCSMTRMTGGRL